MGGKKHPEIKPKKLVKIIKEKFNLDPKTARKVYEESEGIIEQYKIQGDKKELLACFKDYETLDEYLNYLEEEVIPRFKEPEMDELIYQIKPDY